MPHPAVVAAVLLLLAAAPAAHAAASAEPAAPPPPSGTLVAYQMTKVQAECSPACGEGEVCREGKCMAAQREERLNAAKLYCDPLRYVKGDDECLLRADLKPVNVAGAWALEFFVGFGAGAWYAHDTGLGVTGAVFSAIFWAGLGAVIANDLGGDTLSKGKGPFGLGFMALGLTGRVVTIVAVPISAASLNRRIADSQTPPPAAAADAFLLRVGARGPEVGVTPSPGGLRLTF